MSSQARELLTSFFTLDPVLDALPFAGLEQLPALQWKQRNLEIFRARRPHDFATQHGKSLLRDLLMRPPFGCSNARMSPQ